MSTINAQLLIDAAKKGAAVVAGLGTANEGKFSGGGRIKELIVLQKGDVVTIPSDAKCQLIPIRGRKDANGNPLTFEGVYAQLERGGQTMAIAITPGTFSRNFEIVDPETRQGTGARAACSGTAVDEFFSGLDLDDQMHKLYGKPFEVADKKQEWSYNPDFMSKPQKTAVYVLNLK